MTATMALSDAMQGTHDYETGRTQAVPRHTLFGTTLESHSQEDLERIRHLDLNELRLREQLGGSTRHNYQLPEHLMGSTTGQREKLDSMQRRLQEQQERATDASKGLRSLEEMYKYFKVDDASRSLDCSAERSEALGVRSDPVNQMSNGRTLGRRYGLHSSVTMPFHTNDRSIDRDLQPPVFLDHLSSHGANRRETISDKALRRDKGPPRSMTHRTYFEHDRDSNDKLISLPNGQRLPANIQHKFGTRLCQSLFSGPCLVDQTVPYNRTSRTSEGPDRQRDNRPGRPDADYHSLGHLLRYNFGQTYDSQFDKGVTQSDFNSSVHSRSLPITDQHRYRKDDLNKWAEQDVIRSRTTKVWDERQAQMREAKAAAV